MLKKRHKQSSCLGANKQIIFFFWAALFAALACDSNKSQLIFQPVDTDSASIDAEEGGCGQSPPDSDDTYVQIQVLIEGKTEQRQFFISIPPDYDPNKKSRLIIGLHGKDYDGQQMQDWLGLESELVPPKNNELFVYPDGLLRQWEGDWGSSIGWQLGPGALNSEAPGEADLVYIYELINYMKSEYCIDSGDINLVGQGWGGDFAAVLSCIKGDLFNKSVMVGANGVFYFENPPVQCEGSLKTWIMHPLDDPNFPIHLGYQLLDFWTHENGCDDSIASLGIETADGLLEDCSEYTNCFHTTRWCAFRGANQPWDYFATETMRFLRN